MKAFNGLLSFLLGVAIGYMSPWPMSDAHFWLIIAPCCALIGVLMGLMA